jgi:anti-sigma B factor antagonist
MANFEVARKDNEGVSILSLVGYLDAHTAPEFEKALNKLIQEKRFKIIVSLEGLQYISSDGLGVFLEFIDEVREHDGDIKITHTSPRVFKVFDLVGYPRLYEFYDSTEEALKKFTNCKAPRNLT